MHAQCSLRFQRQKSIKLAATLAASNKWMVMARVALEK